MAARAGDTENFSSAGSKMNRNIGSFFVDFIEFFKHCKTLPEESEADVSTKS